MEGRRRYELKERARKLEETHGRIVDAALALHAEVGPARTAIAEVARRAGVGRVTVYNHFPDEGALLRACWERFTARHPPPDPAAWAAIADPEKRLKAALRETWAYFAANEAMLAGITRDAPQLPALAALLDEAGVPAREAEARDVLMPARKPGGKKEQRVRAAIGLALAFATWQRLTRDEGLPEKEAVKVMLRAVAAA